MQEETKSWLTYSEENLEAAKVLFESELYNPCLNNIQQSIEKALKSLLIENALSFKKTHNIMELKTTLDKNSVSIELTEDECDFLVAFIYPQNILLEVLSHSFILIKKLQKFYLISRKNIKRS